MHVGLIHIVTVLRDSPTGGDDEWGLPEESVVTVASNVPALVQPRTGREQPVPSGVEITDALVFLPYGTDVRSGDVIAHGSDTYRVVGEPINAGGANHHVEILGRKVLLGG